MHKLTKYSSKYFYQKVECHIKYNAKKLWLDLPSSEKLQSCYRKLQDNTFICVVFFLHFLVLLIACVYCIYSTFSL